MFFYITSCTTLHNRTQWQCPLAENIALLLLLLLLLLIHEIIIVKKVFDEGAAREARGARFYLHATTLMQDFFNQYYQLLTTVSVTVRQHWLWIGDVKEERIHLNIK